MSVLNSTQKIQLPFWLKMFASEPSEELIGQSSDHSEELTSIVPEESISKIARLLTQKKTIFLMSNGKPFKIYEVDGSIKVEPLASNSFEFR